MERMYLWQKKFDADTFNYTASATESGVTISATAEEADAIVNVIWKDTVIQTGTGSAATELGLTEGDNTVKVRVTSADGSTEKDLYSNGSCIRRDLVV